MNCIHRESYDSIFSPLFPNFIYSYSKAKWRQMNKNNFMMDSIEVDDLNNNSYASQIRNSNHSNIEPWNKNSYFSSRVHRKVPNPTLLTAHRRNKTLNVRTITPIITCEPKRKEFQRSGHSVPLSVMHFYPQTYQKEEICSISSPQSERKGLCVTLNHSKLLRMKSSHK